MNIETFFIPSQNLSSKCYNKTTTMWHWTIVVTVVVAIRTIECVFIGFCVVGTLHHHPFSPKLEILQKCKCKIVKKSWKEVKKRVCVQSKQSWGISASKRKVCENSCSIINVENKSLATSLAYIRKLMDMGWRDG